VWLEPRSAAAAPSIFFRVRRAAVPLSRAILSAIEARLAALNEQRSRPGRSAIPSPGDGRCVAAALGGPRHHPASVSAVIAGLRILELRGCRSLPDLESANHERPRARQGRRVLRAVLLTLLAVDYHARALKMGLHCQSRTESA